VRRVRAALIMADLSDTTALRAGDHTVYRELDGEAVILNLDAATYFGLDATGTRIWQLIEAHGRLDAVLAALADEYDASTDTLRADLFRLASQLVDKHLLVIDDARSGA
jgi:hypothetical protein